MNSDRFFKICIIIICVTLLIIAFNLSKMNRYRIYKGSLIKGRVLGIYILDTHSGQYVFLRRGTLINRGSFKHPYKKNKTNTVVEDNKNKSLSQEVPEGRNYNPEDREPIDKGQSSGVIYYDPDEWEPYIPQK